MKFLDADFSGSIQISGSLTIPKGTADQRPVNPETGSLFLELSDSGSNIKIYNGQSGSGWEIAGINKNALRRTFAPIQADIEYLVVAGGGGGGGWGGGGGAGGLLSSSLSSVESGSSFTVTVGAGSAGGPLSEDAGGYVVGIDGTDSSLAGTGYTTVTATGGGGGGRHNGYTIDNGRDGGSGGGAGMHATNNNVVGGGSGGSGTTGQGNSGGGGGGSSTGNSVYYRGGGGGGAATVGEDGTGHNSGGNGGDGKASKITGTSTYYAGGGGSHTDRRSGAGVTSGGLGGGGAGGGYQTDTHAEDGTANTGGGGGGSYGYANSHQGGGGSGVVILAYDSGSIKGLGGHEGDAGNGRRYHKFGSSATFYIGGTSDFAYVTDDLLMHYDFANAATWDGSASTITDLQGNHNLSINSTPTLNLTHGGGLDLDGVDDYASKESSISYTPYMAEIWLTTDVAIDTNTYTDSNYAIPLALGIYPGGFSFGAYTGNMTNETIAFWGANYTSTGATYIQDTFSAGTYQIVANWNGSSYDIWVNGSKKTTYAINTYGHTTLHARDSIILGKEDHASQSYEFGGKIHNVKIYNAQKTDADVTQNWNALKNRFGL